MKSKIYTFEGPDATVTWDRKRCIHFEACVHGLPGVFDPNRRPWIAPEEAPTDALLNVIRNCPTGALHLRRADGTNPEPAPATARVKVASDGPLYIEGDVTIQSADGEILLRDTRVALCRCGLSDNKPLCDNSHLEGFADPGRLPETGATDIEAGSGLRVTVRPNGSLLFEGPFTIVGADGGKTDKKKAAFCRCGHSQNKPFCDRSHVAAGFVAD